MIETWKINHPIEALEAIHTSSGFIFCFYGYNFDYAHLQSILEAKGAPFVGCMDIGRFLNGKYYSDPDSAVIMQLPFDMFESIVVVPYPMDSKMTYEEISKKAKKQLEYGFRKSHIDPKSPDLERDIVINICYGLQSANPVLSALQELSTFVQSVGGSSGGKLDFVSSNVMCREEYGNIGVTAFLKLSKDYKMAIDLSTNYDKIAGEPLVVTSLGSPRNIKEFNGKPAMEEFSKRINIPASQMSPSTYAIYTLGLDTGNNEKLITSIMKDDGNGGLLTYNDTSLGTSFSVYKSLLQEPGRIKKLDAIPKDSLVAYISFDCVLCYLARDANQEIEQVAAMYERQFPGVPKIGFGTFGENMCGANVNQTETFLAIMKA